MKLPAHFRISRETACQRVLRYLYSQRVGYLAGAAEIAGVVWPGHQMTAQGAGAAASRILNVLKDAGLVRWNALYRNDQDSRKATDWGYAITSSGRAQARAVLVDES